MSKITSNLLILVMVYTSCYQADHFELDRTVPISEAVDSASIIQDFKWTEIVSPFPLRVIASAGNKLIALGERGAVEVGENDGVQPFGAFEITGAFTSTDGWLTIRPSREKLGDANLCFPLAAKLISESIYVFAQCETTSQVWNIKIGENISILKVTDFLPVDGGGSRQSFGPTRMCADCPRPMFPSLLRTGPALLVPKSDGVNYEVMWSGKQEDGGIAGVSFVGQSGWMLTSGGKVLRSYGYVGQRWNFLSDIPMEARNEVVDLKMLDESIGYVIGLKGLLLCTKDGGKTWTREDSGLRSTLYKIRSGRYVTVTGSYGALLVWDSDDLRWRIVDLPLKGDVTDVTYRGKKMYVLISGRLFYTELDLKRQPRQ